MTDDALTALADDVEIIARTHRLVSVEDLSAIFALLPPAPQAVNGKIYSYQDPDAATRLHQVRERFEAMLMHAADITRLAAQSQSGENAGWKSIDSFPRDGETYLATNNTIAGGRPQIVYYDEGWLYVPDAEISYGIDFFTHWKSIEPLPARTAREDKEPGAPQ